MPQPKEMDATEIKVRFTKKEVSAIWPGLDYINRQFLAWDSTGGTVSSYPFRIQPLPPGFDSGTFSNRMMDRIRDLWVRMKAAKTCGGELWLDEFQLRAAAFSARTSMKLKRREMKRVSKREANALRRVAGGRRTFKLLKDGKDRVIESLEIDAKRAQRRFKAAVGVKKYGFQCKEWQSHLRWVKFRLTYFKPFRPLKVSVSQMRRAWVDRLVQMAEKTIVNQGYEVPDSKKLQKVIREYLRYSRRGRMGEYHHLYMLKNVESSEAQLKLLEFVEERLLLKEAS